MKFMKKILVAEDEASIREFITVNLIRSGFVVAEAHDGKSAIELFDREPHDFNIVILDIMMPNIDGLNVCRYIRSIDPNVGIIFLSAKTQESDKLEGLKLGADDYITKPFSVSELLARIESVNRRVELAKALLETNGTDEIKSGKFVLNTKRRAVFADGVKIDLSQIEFEILEYFFSNPNKTITRNEILNRVWGENYFGDDKVVDVNIRRLRIKIEKDPSIPENLLTVWGQGYKWIEG